MKMLKQSTIDQYSLIQLAKHADRFHDHHNLNLYRFDFSYGTVYETTGRNSFFPFLSLYENSSNRAMMKAVLLSIYEAAKWTDCKEKLKYHS